MEKRVIYDKVRMPEICRTYVPVNLTERTMTERYNRVLSKMQELDLDTLVIYADREHGANFAYLTGFEPRFEEALLVLHGEGINYLVLGNENLKMAKYSRIQAEVVHAPHFSLPYQPMGDDKSLSGIMRDAGIYKAKKIGCAGWKMFTGTKENCREMFDIPAFIMDALKCANPYAEICNAAGIFVDSKSGVRNHVNANEIAHYEFGSGLASSRILQAMNAVAPGKTEMEIAEVLSPYGQPATVTTICAAGERFTDAVVFPRANKIELGDKLSLTLGLRGGLSSRAAYVAEKCEELPEDVRDYIEVLAVPYYEALAEWMEAVGIGASCADIYERIETVLPKEKFHWVLNPGHYTADDEWTASPFYPGTEVVLESGVILQADIIPSMQGYGGVSAEDGVVIADEELQGQMKSEYPEMWARMQRRKQFMKQELGIRLKDETFPMSDICGYLRPLILNHTYALKKII